MSSSPTEGQNAAATSAENGSNNNNPGGGGGGGSTGGDDGEDPPIALCASCDRCRARKTKCDGKRPCGNCATKYMKKHKVTSIEGVDLSLFECVYSPAKRRGPVPGKSGQTRKSSELGMSESSAMMGGGGMAMQVAGPNADWSNAGAVGSPQNWNGPGGPASAFSTARGGGMGALGGLGGPMGGGGDNGSITNALQQQLGLLRQLQQQQPQPGAGGRMELDETGTEEPSAQRIKRFTESDEMQGPTVPRTITTHTHLLERSDSEGSRLYAYYKLSIDEMFHLPTTPTDDEYCTRVPGMTPDSIPGPHLAALSAARFAELSLGALVHNEISTAMELCNAVVHCLRESVQETVQSTPVMILYEVAKAYFLLGVFRAFRGDMARYFKYRRVCMTYLSKLEDDKNTSTLLSAVSFLDAWAYMVYNANEKSLPSIDDSIPPVAGCGSFGGGCGQPNSNGERIDIRTDPLSIATDPKNQNWIQGAPPVYLNNEAPMHARSLDAIACAVRTCCDQANGRFAEIAKQADASNVACQIPQETIITPTSTAVLAHENDLCSRNMVLSAYTLMQQEESTSGGRRKNEGLHMVISAMDAFLENSDDEGQSGFTDSQIQSLLSVCNTALENPYLLHHAGPTYHMVSNAAVLLCHLLNGMYSMKQNGGFGSMESTLFEEVLDTLIPIRKLLTIHRRKLPVKLRCHGIPRPRIDPPTGREPFIDLGETLLCSCRGCQGFVLMACSPCVAAERARNAANRMTVESAQEQEAVELGEIDKELDDLGAQFNLDDDALLGMISSLISN